MYRRTPLTLLLVALVATAGCVGVITGSEPLVLSADPVSVSASAQSEAGYEETRVTTQTLNEEVAAAGQTREVEVTNHLAEYSRTIDAGPLGSGEFARFIVVSTPAVEVVGQTFNPIGDMSARELVQQLQSQYEGLQNIQPAGERQATLLGSAETVELFSGEAEVGGSGQTVDVTINVVKVRSGGDFLVVIGVYPTLLNGEADRFDTMLGGVRHDG